MLERTTAISSHGLRAILYAVFSPFLVMHHLRLLYDRVWWRFFSFLNGGVFLNQMDGWMFLNETDGWMDGWMDE